MNIANLLHRYARFNRWANERIAEWLAAKPSDMLHRELVSSFPSIRKTLEHIASAEWIWLERLQGRSPRHFPEGLDGSSDAAFFDFFIKNAAAFEAEICGYDEARLGENCAYNFFNGDPGASIRAEMIQHCIQHSSFHRGQIVTMARQLGWTDIPRQDFIVFTREQPFEV